MKKNILKICSLILALTSLSILSENDTNKSYLTAIKYGFVRGVKFNKNALSKISSTLSREDSAAVEIIKKEDSKTISKIRRFYNALLPNSDTELEEIAAEINQSGIQPEATPEELKKKRAESREQVLQILENSNWNIKEIPQEDKEILTKLFGTKGVWGFIIRLLRIRDPKIEDVLNKFGDDEPSEEESTKFNEKIEKVAQQAIKNRLDQIKKIQKENEDKKISLDEALTKIEQQEEKRATNTKQTQTEKKQTATIEIQTDKSFLLDRSKSQVSKDKINQPSKVSVATQTEPQVKPSPSPEKQPKNAGAETQAPEKQTRSSQAQTTSQSVASTSAETKSLTSSQQAEGSKSPERKSQISSESSITTSNTKSTEEIQFKPEKHRALKQDKMPEMEQEPTPDLDPKENNAFKKTTRQQQSIPKPIQSSPKSKISTGLLEIELDGRKDQAIINTRLEKEKQSKNLSMRLASKRVQKKTNSEQNLLPKSIKQPSSKPKDPEELPKESNWWEEETYKNKLQEVGPPEPAATNEDDFLDQIDPKIIQWARKNGIPEEKIDALLNLPDDIVFRPQIQPEANSSEQYPSKSPREINNEDDDSVEWFDRDITQKTTSDPIDEDEEFNKKIADLKQKVTNVTGLRRQIIEKPKPTTQLQQILQNEENELIKIYQEIKTQHPNKIIPQQLQKAYDEIQLKPERKNKAKKLIEKSKKSGSLDRANSIINNANFSELPHHDNGRLDSSMPIASPTSKITKETGPESDALLENRSKTALQEEQQEIAEAYQDLLNTKENQNISFAEKSLKTTGVIKALEQSDGKLAEILTNDKKQQTTLVNITAETETSSEAEAKTVQSDRPNQTLQDQLKVFERRRLVIFHNLILAIKNHYTKEAKDDKNLVEIYSKGIHYPEALLPSIIAISKYIPINQDGSISEKFIDNANYYQYDKIPKVTEEELKQLKEISLSEDPEVKKYVQDNLDETSKKNINEYLGKITNNSNFLNPRSTASADRGPQTQNISLAAPQKFKTTSNLTPQAIATASATHQPKSYKVTAMQDRGNQTLGVKKVLIPKQLQTFKTKAQAERIDNQTVSGNFNTNEIALRSMLADSTDTTTQQTTSSTPAVALNNENQATNPTGNITFMTKQILQPNDSKRATTPPTKIKDSGLFEAEILPEDDKTQPIRTVKVKPLKSQVINVQETTTTQTQTQKIQDKSDSFDNQLKLIKQDVRKNDEEINNSFLVSNELTPLVALQELQNQDPSHLGEKKSKEEWPPARPGTAQPNRKTQNKTSLLTTSQQYDNPPAIAARPPTVMPTAPSKKRRLKNPAAKQIPKLVGLQNPVSSKNGAGMAIEPQVISVKSNHINPEQIATEELIKLVDNEADVSQQINQISANLKSQPLGPDQTKTVQIQAIKEISEKIEQINLQENTTHEFEPSGALSARQPGVDDSMILIKHDPTKKTDPEKLFKKKVYTQNTPSKNKPNVTRPQTAAAPRRRQN